MRRRIVYCDEGLGGFVCFLFFVFPQGGGGFENE